MEVTKKSIKLGIQVEPKKLQEDLSRAAKYAAKELGRVPQSAKDWENSVKSIHRGYTNVTAEIKKQKDAIDRLIKEQSVADKNHLSSLKQETEERKKQLQKLEQQETRLRMMEQAAQRAQGRANQDQTSQVGSQASHGGHGFLATSIDAVKEAPRNLPGALMAGSSIASAAGQSTGMSPLLKMGLGLGAVAGAAFLLKEVAEDEMRKAGSYAASSLGLARRSKTGTDYAGTIMSSGMGMDLGYDPESMLAGINSLQRGSGSALTGNGWQQKVMSAARFTRENDLSFDDTANAIGTGVRSGALATRGGSAVGQDSYQRFLETAMFKGTKAGLDGSRTLANINRTQEKMAEGAGGATSVQGVRNMLVYAGMLSGGDDRLSKTMQGEKGMSAMAALNNTTSGIGNTPLFMARALSGQIFGRVGKDKQGNQTLDPNGMYGRVDVVGMMRRLQKENPGMMPQAAASFVGEELSSQGIGLHSLWQLHKTNPWGAESILANTPGISASQQMAIRRKLNDPKMTEATFEKEMSQYSAGHKTEAGNEKGEEWEKLEARLKKSDLVLAQAISSALKTPVDTFAAATEKFAKAVLYLSGDNESNSLLGSVRDSLKKFGDEHKSWLAPYQRGGSKSETKRTPSGVHGQ